MSSYPPGVTGNEFAIAGAREWRGPVVCGASADFKVVWADDLEALREMQAVLRGEHLRASITAAMIVNRILKKLLTTIDGRPETTFMTCMFEGEVDGTEFARVREWDCPCCGTTHQIFGNEDE